MRLWVSRIEEYVDQKLKRFKKGDRIENGEVVTLSWQYLQTTFTLEIFWEDHVETVRLIYNSPRNSQDFLWHGLNNKTVNRIVDRVGNLAQHTLAPPIEPEV